MNKEFRRYEFHNHIKSILNRLWSFLENHGFPGTVDKMAVRKYYAGKRVLGDTETNAFISNGINASNGFMAARFGAVELNYIYYYLRKQLGDSDIAQRKEALRMLCFNAGFFPADEKLADKMAQLYLNACAEMDLCGAWNINMEDYVFKKYTRGCEVTRLRCLEPWITEEGRPWTTALSGKKVLVIHPFAGSMEKQYKNRTKLFTNGFSENDILPPMEISFMPAVQSIGGQGAGDYESWFDAYEHMVSEIKKRDFEVAVLGCGAYGFPLAAEIKRMGKKAVHLGGATQLWLGIRGKRWDNDPLISRFYNEYWISPSDKEKPANAEGVEGGCYW